jgi:hypothetical protein
VTFARKPFAAVFLFLFALSLFHAPRAQADANIGDAALTVAVATVAGAVLGASTLPFYDESGEHTKNIFYGAAIGAVVGVFISAYAGVQEGPNFDDARLAPRKPSELSLNEAPAFRLSAEGSTAVRKPASFASGTTLLWSPVASVKF